jgi:hypothetical protein
VGAHFADIRAAAGRAFRLEIDQGRRRAAPGNGNARHAYIDPKYGRDALATF